MPKIISVVMAGLFLLSSPYLPAPDTMGTKGLITLAILMFGIVLWFTTIIPTAITGLVIIVLFPLFEILTFEESTSGLGQGVTYLIISILMLGVAVEKTEIDKRLALNMLLLAKGNTKLTIFMIIAVTFVLTFIIPNGFGRLVVMIPIAVGLIKCMQEEGGENIGKAIMLAVTFSPWISIAMLITGSTGAIYAVSLFEKMLDYKWGYIHWMVVMIPGTILILIALWLLVIWKFPAATKKIMKGQQYSLEEKKKLGPVSKNEIKLILLYFGLIFLWITKEFHQISISMSAVLIVIFLFIPGFNLITWKEAKNKVDWSIPLIFAAGFTFALAFEKSGIVIWMAILVDKMLGDLHIFSIALGLMLAFTIIRLGFINFTAMIASLLPVALTFAANTPYNPVWLGLICVVSSSLCFLFPSQSIGNMTTFPLGYYSSQDMFIIGGLLTLIVIIITLFMAFFYWPLVGLPFAYH